MTRNRVTWRLALAMGSLSIGCATAAQFAYPPAGRTAEQQQQDQYECHQWAVVQSNYDPTRPTPDADVAVAGTASAGSPGGAAVSGATRGVAVAEIADDDAGDGARAGAAVGLLRQRRAQAAATQENVQAQRAAEQRKQQQAALRSSYDSARNTCLRARGYTLSEP